jgi:hypothetical protein
MNDAAKQASGIAGRKVQNNHTSKHIITNTERDKARYARCDRHALQRSLAPCERWMHRKVHLSVQAGLELTIDASPEYVPFGHPHSPC